MMVYMVQIFDAIKIGVSSNPARRLEWFKVAWPYEPKILAVFKGGRDVERLLHHRFKSYRLRGEWFKVNDELLEYAAAKGVAVAAMAQSRPHKRRQQNQRMTHALRRQRLDKIAAAAAAGRTLGQLKWLFQISSTTIIDACRARGVIPRGYPEKRGPKNGKLYRRVRGGKAPRR